MEPENERVAGWIDGITAGGRAFRKAARQSLRRFHLDLRGDRIVARPRVPEPDPPPVGPDNPENNPHYTEGWRQGLLSGRQSASRKLRDQLADYGMHITISGTLITLATLDRLADEWSREQDNQDMEDALTDEALHAFLDDDGSNDFDDEFDDEASDDDFGDSPLSQDPPREDEHDADPAESPSEPTTDVGSPESVTSALVDLDSPRPPALSSHSPTEPPSPRALRSRLHGAWIMVRKNIDRRTAVAALIGAFATGGGIIGFTKKPEPAPTPLPEKTQPTEMPAGAQGSGMPNGAPAHWAIIPEPNRGILYSIYAFVAQAEALGQSQLVHQLLGQVITSSSFPDDLKFLVAMYVRDVERWDLLVPLATGISASPHNTDLRRMIAAACLSGARRAPLAVDPALKPAIAEYLANATETDPEVNTFLTRALALLP